MATLPIPSQEAQAHSAQLISLIQHSIVQHQGWLDFASFMQMALYTPQLGYYSGGAKKFGVGGDFVTAPEISPLFARSLAKQVAQVLVETGGSVLELGAGTGKLAGDLMLTLAQLQQLPTHYYILEVSEHLCSVQHDYLQMNLSEDLFARVVWLDAMPESFVGAILGNEVLDAVPVQLVYKNDGKLYERGLAWNEGLYWQDKSLSQGALYDEASLYDLPDDYLTEFNPRSVGLVNSLAGALKQGVILMLDYGFGAAEYYHPQRNQGTLMCHFQHYAHSDPLLNIGLQDITAHVNFTAIAEAGFAQGLNVAYNNQASFLINCGLLELLAQVPADDMAAYAPLVAATQKLLSPAEMGELFKVIALSKGMNSQLIGFVQGDKRHML
jgi:SAM-dependent MidA family methyltransferase